MKNPTLRNLTLPCVFALGLGACQTEDAAYAVVGNDYPVATDSHDPSQQTTVYKVWWSTALFSSPVAAGGESETIRAVAGGEVAYALLAPGWDPTSSDPPSMLIPVMTHIPLTVSRGTTLHIHLSDTTVVGNCGARASGQLTQDEADFITQRIFPGDFIGTYNAKACAISR